MTNKEKQLLKDIGLYISKGNKDGDFILSWLDNWNSEEINSFDEELMEYFNVEDLNIPDYFILCTPISNIFNFLLWKLTEKKPKFSLSIENYR